MTCLLRGWLGALIVPAALSIFVSSTPAQTVWSGLTKTFAKASGSDGTLPANQDPLTASVVLTRLNSGGLVNIASESFFTQGISPANTKWATDLNNPSQSIAATNWQNLAFTDWIDAYGGSHSGGGRIADRSAVVYLVSDNIYLDLKFTNWTAGVGGGYSYMRAEPPTTPIPTGDYNHNGVVDAADYVVWRDTLTQTVSPAGSGADGDSSGTIDAGDFNFWRINFSNPAGSGLGAANVPEPITLALFPLGLSLLASPRGGRRACS